MQTENCTSENDLCMKTNAYKDKDFWCQEHESIILH